MARLRRASAVLGGLLVTFGLYGVVVEPRLLLDDEAFEVEVPGLPTEWDGRRVVLLADTQTGMWLDNLEMVEEAVDEAIEARPALALLAGDFVYKADSSVVRHAVALMRPLAAAGIPTVAVLGNHDYGMNRKDGEPDEALAASLRRQLEVAGIRVVENEHVAVPAPGGGPALHVVGVGSLWAGHSDPAIALVGLAPDAPRLALMHNPQSFQDFPAGTAPVALAGHTHGGQVRIPGLPRWSWLDIVREGEVAVDGWIPAGFGAAGNRLYVNRGIGFSTVPVRVNCRPELTTVTLRRPAGAAVAGTSRTTDG